MYETKVPLSIFSKKLILAHSVFCNNLENTPCFTFLPVENIILRYKNVNIKDIIFILMSFTSL